MTNITITPPPPRYTPPPPQQHRQMIKQGTQYKTHAMHLLHTCRMLGMFWST
jgi:hypothetical protein